MTPHSKCSVSEEQLLVNAMDLFSAGSETTATTLAWAVGDMNMICVNWIFVDVRVILGQDMCGY